MDPGSIAAVIVSIVAAAGGVLAQRASAKAARDSAAAQAAAAKELAKENVEKDAYDRARTMDVATIDRQNLEIRELQEENKLLREMNGKLNEVKDQNYHLNADVKRVDRDNLYLLDQNDELKAKINSLEAEVITLKRGQRLNNVAQVRPREGDTLPNMPRAVNDGN